MALAKRLALVPLGVAIGCGGGGELLGSIGGDITDASHETSERDAADQGSDGTSESREEGDSLTVDADLGRFGPPVIVSELSSPAYDEDPTFTEDLLEIYFTSNRGGDLDIWRSLRPARDARWGVPTRVPELSSLQVDETPSISLDGLTIWFSSTRPASHKGHNIWVSARASRTGAWSTPSEVSEVNGDGEDLAPATDEGDLIMAFATDRAGGTAQDIYFSTRASNGAPWSPPAPADSLNSRSYEWDPFLGASALVMFFNSDRGGMAGDLYWATRSSLIAPFGPWIRLDELNSPANESDPTLTRDLRYILFASNRSGNSEIYEARR
jgi:hypothetical protein